jgi:hypothetical protein
LPISAAFVGRTRALRQFRDDSSKLIDDPWAVDLAGRIAVVACNRQGVAGDIGAVRPQHEVKCLADPGAAALRGDIEEGDWLAVEGTAPDSPVQRILERAGDPERVLGNRKQDSSCLLARRSEAQHRLGRFCLQVGVEMRQPRTESSITTIAPSRAAAEAAARRTALLIELRLRLPEIAKILSGTCGICARLLSNERRLAELLFSPVMVGTADARSHRGNPLVFALVRGASAFREAHQWCSTSGQSGR